MKAKVSIAVVAILAVVGLLWSNRTSESVEGTSVAQVVEPTSEQTVEPMPEPILESTAEPTLEPTPAPALQTPAVENEPFPGFSELAPEEQARILNALSKGAKPGGLTPVTSTADLNSIHTGDYSGITVN